jgi:hypothetical protein
LEFAVPPHWRKAFDLRDYLPTSDDKARFISECERDKQNKTPPARERDGSDDDCKSSKNNKFAKSEKSATKSGKKTNTESDPMYCTHCKTDTHVRERLLKDAVQQSSGIHSGFYCPMSDLALFYVGYGLPHRVLI